MLYKPGGSSGLKGGGNSNLAAVFAATNSRASQLSACRLRACCTFVYGAEV